MPLHRRERGATDASFRRPLSVLGVTQEGARLQVREALLDLATAELKKGPSGHQLDGFDPDNEDYFDQLPSDLAQLVLSSIDKLFPVATSIQYWLGTCLYLVVHADAPKGADFGKGNSMEWTSPLGLPVVQAYREIGTKTVSAKAGSRAVGGWEGEISSDSGAG